MSDVRRPLFVLLFVKFRRKLITNRNAGPLNVLLIRVLVMTGLRVRLVNGVRWKRFRVVSRTNRLRLVNRW